jgi:hypothetical protein
LIPNGPGIRPPRRFPALRVVMRPTRACSRAMTRGAAVAVAITALSESAARPPGRQVAVAVHDASLAGEPAPAVSCGQAYAGVQTPQHSDGGLGDAFFDAFDLVGRAVAGRPASRPDQGPCIGDIGAADYSWEPNWEPTTTATGPRLATSSHCDHSYTARHAVPDATGPHFESAS